ncbi:MAG: restriction endonuclease subunit S [Bacteroidia bacterium]|nr:restriction endonuclease subunit S [Bacteroidia bacterium]
MKDKWVKHKIKDFGRILTGTTPSSKKKEFYGGSYKLISPKDLDRGKSIKTSHKLLTEEGIKVARTLPKNAVLVGCIGNIGKIGMTTDEVSAFNQQINAIICNENYDPDFIYYLVLYNRPILVQASVKTTLPILNKSNFQEIELPTPGIFEQRRIAYVLSTVQQAIELQDQLIELTSELKKALVHKLFTEGIKSEPKKMTEIGPIPESWTLVMFDKFTTLQRGKDLTKKEFIKGEIPVAGAISIIGYHNEANVTGPGVTVTRSGSSAGKATFYSNDFWAHNVVLYVKDFHGNHPKFCYYQLNNLKLEKYKSGVAVPTLNRNTFRSILVPVPSLEEQIKMTKILDSIDDKLSVHKKKKKSLESLFRTLLHKLMTAEISVSNLDFDTLEKSEAYA